jgi:hypothetical protein
MEYTVAEVGFAFTNEAGRSPWRDCGCSQEVTLEDDGIGECSCGSSGGGCSEVHESKTFDLTALGLGVRRLPHASYVALCKWVVEKVPKVGGSAVSLSRLEAAKMRPKIAQEIVRLSGISSEPCNGECGCQNGG